MLPCTGSCNGNFEQCTICNHKWTKEEIKELEEALEKVFAFRLARVPQLAEGTSSNLANCVDSNSTSGTKYE